MTYGPRAPVFVVGHPRSGTTLLASMLGRHPLIASTPESLFMSQARYDLKLSPAMKPAAIAEQVMSTPLSHLVTDRAAFEVQLAAAIADGGVTERAVFAAAMEHFRIAKERGRVLEKSPWHLRAMPEILEWFPDARFIWILRDGRGCIASLKKVRWATHDTRTLARQWVRNMSFGLEGEARVGRALLQIRYEDLLANPRPVMERVFEHIGLALDERVFDHREEVSTIKASEVDWKQNVLRPLMGDRAQAWRRELSEADAALATRLMLPMLVRMCYEPASARPPLAARLFTGIVGQPAVVRALRQGLHLTRRMTGSKPALKRRLGLKRGA